MMSLDEISDIRNKNKRSCIVVQGLSDSKFIEVSSWIKRNELSDLIEHNNDVRFIVGVRVHGE